MSFAAEAQALESRFQTEWGDTTPIEFDNIKFDPVATAAYVKFEIHNGETARVGLGEAYTERTPGIVSINIFIPRDMGSRQGRVLADTAAAIFRDWTNGPLRCGTPGITRLGDSGDWYVTNVSIPFQRDEQFS